MTRRVAPLVLVAAACSRTPAPAGADAGAPLPVASSAPAPSSVPSAAASAVAAPLPNAVAVRSAEATRVHVARFAESPQLAVAGAELEKHFSGLSPTGYDVQIATLEVGHRRAVLVAETAAGRPSSELKPIVLVEDDAGRVAWSKPRPIAGIVAPVSALAIAGGPRGRIALAACNPPTKSVALRLWDDDGSPFADYQVLEVESCEGLSLFYWQGKGWVVVAASADATRARLVHESGSLGWGRGLDLGARSAIASLAADSEDTFVLAQAVQPSKVAGSPFHVLAFRYDARGTAIWPAAVDLGELAHPPAPGARVIVAPEKPAGVRVTVPGDFEIGVRPSGDLSPRRRAPP